MMNKKKLLTILLLTTLNLKATIKYTVNGFDSLQVGNKHLKIVKVGGRRVFLVLGSGCRAVSKKKKINSDLPDESKVLEVKKENQDLEKEARIVLLEAQKNNRKKQGKKKDSNEHAHNNVRHCNWNQDSRSGLSGQTNRALKHNK